MAATREWNRLTSRPFKSRRLKAGVHSLETSALTDVTLLILVIAGAIWAAAMALFRAADSVEFLRTHAHLWDLHHIADRRILRH